MKRYICFFLFFFAISSCSRDLNSVRLFECSQDLNQPYGIVAHVGGRYSNPSDRNATIESIAGIGVDIIRTDFYWKIIQPTSRYRRDYSHLDSLMISLKLKNIKISPILDYTIDEYKDIWNHIDKWEEYVNGVVYRYGSKVNYWEVWNEENNPNLWGDKPSAEHYLNLLRKSSSIIKSKEPKSIVLLGGISIRDLNFLREIVKYGGVDLFDIINVHYYNPDEEPEAIIDELYKLKSVMQEYNIDKKVWITETGYSTYRNEKEQLDRQVSEELQAIWLPRTFLTAFSYGIDKMFWYCHRTDEKRNNREDYFGIVHKDLTPKPAYYTFQTLIQMCPDKSSRPSLIKRGNVYISWWKNPEKRKVWAVWTSKEPEQVSLKIKGKYKCFKDNGDEILNMNPSKVIVKPSVLYIVGAKNVIINQD